MQQAGHEALVLRLRQVLVLAQDLRQLLISHSFCCSSEVVKKNSSDVEGSNWYKSRVEKIKRCHDTFINA